MGIGHKWTFIRNINPGWCGSGLSAGLKFLGSSVITVPFATEVKYFWQWKLKWGRNDLYNIMTKIKRWKKAV